MTLWGYIPEKVLVSSGSLPATGRRLDTGQIIDSLSGFQSHWANACGYYDLDNFDLTAVRNAKQLTQGEADTLAADVAEALSLQGGRESWRIAVESSVADQSPLWDWRDAYGVPGDGSPNAGASWTFGSSNSDLFAGMNVLQEGTDAVMRVTIHCAEALQVILELLTDLIDNGNFTPPS